MFNYNRTPIKFQQADPTAGFPSSPGDCTDGGNEFNE
jgi:hypothetical protein